MTLFVAPVVEGRTETNSIKVLLARIWRELLDGERVEPLAVLPPVPIHRSAALAEAGPELATKLERAARNMRQAVRHGAGNRGFILLLLDADEDSPDLLRRTLSARSHALHADLDVCCAIAVREFENWFKAAASSLAGQCGLPPELVTPSNPEVGSGAKWLDDQIRKHQRDEKYRKVIDAPVFAAALDLALCRANSPSFDKLCRELEARRPGAAPAA